MAEVAMCLAGVALLWAMIAYGIASRNETKLEELEARMNRQGKGGAPSFYGGGL